MIGGWPVCFRYTRAACRFVFPACGDVIWLSLFTVSDCVHENPWHPALLRFSKGRSWDVLVLEFVSDVPERQRRTA